MRVYMHQGLYWVLSLLMGSIVVPPTDRFVLQLSWADDVPTVESMFRYRKAPGEEQTVTKLDKSRGKTRRGLDKSGDKAGGIVPEGPAKDPWGDLSVTSHISGLLPGELSSNESSQFLVNHDMFTS